MSNLQKYMCRKKAKDLMLKYLIWSQIKMKLKQWHNIFHGHNIFHAIVNTNSMYNWVQIKNIVQIKNEITKHVSVKVKIIVCAKEITVGVLAQVFVRIASILKILLILQWSGVVKLYLL